MSNTENGAQIHFQNHVLIGLGGTGGSVLREFRKEIFRRHGSNDPGAGIKLEYLYVDSSPVDLNEKTSWEVLGHSVQLPQNSRLGIEVPNLQTIVENAQAYPGIAPWLGDRELWGTYAGQQQGLKAAGGQRRRLGRLLFAQNIAEYNRQVANLHSSVVGGGQGESAGSTGVTFHVMCGLAGGTGSGALIDAICQIGRFIVERGAQNVDRIVVYAYLPEENPPGNKAERYYIANGYAALLELNALSAGRLHPHNVAADRPFKPGDFVSFNGCYVFTNETETGTSYQPDRVPALLSSFLYQKIVAVGDTTNWDALVRAENSENGIPDPEPRSRPSEERPKAERGVRFLSFGIKRIAIPEPEIQEFLAYTYALEAGKQLKANHWTNDHGFIDRVRNTDFAEYRTDEMLGRFCLTDDHLSLGRPIIEDDAKQSWTPFEEYWQFFLDQCLEDVVSNVDKKYWLSDLRMQAFEQYEKTFRSDGVDGFYERKSGSVQIEAREVARRVEQYLLEQWLDGNLSLAEVTGTKDLEDSMKGIMEVLLEVVRDKRDKLERKIEKLAKKQKEVTEVLGEIETEYSRIWKIDPLNRRNRLRQEFTETLEDLMVIKTNVIAFAYAVQLTKAVETRLEELGGDVAAAAAILNNILREFEDGLGKRCVEGDQMDFGRQFVKFYDVENVKKISNRLRLDPILMKEQAGAVRSAIKERLGFDVERPSFHAFSERLPAADLSQLLEQICADKSRTHHDSLDLEDRERLFGVELVKRITQRYPSESQMAEFAKRLVPQATTLAALDDTEVGNTTANTDPTSVIRRSISVIGKGLEGNGVGGAESAPKVRELREAFVGAPPVGAGPVGFVNSPAQPHELVVVSLSNIMPLRCVKRVAFLRRRYEDLLTGQSGSPQDAIFLHGEGDGTQYPGIFALSMNEVRDRAKRVLLLGVCTGQIKPGEDPRTGKVLLTYTEVDEDGVPVSTLRLGTGIVDSIDALGPDTYRKLSEVVEAVLDGDEYVHIDQKEKLTKSLAAEMTKLGEKLGVGTEQYESWARVYRTLRDELRSCACPV